MRWWHIPTLALLLGATLLLAMAAGARGDPVLRRAAIALPDWPADAAPIRVLVWSDIHLGNRATDRNRLDRLVAQANALRPDLVLLAGDFIAGHERRDAAAAPGLAALARLQAPLGTVAVLGNHDHWTDAAAVRAALGKAGVVVLDNGTVRRGPLLIAGLGDAPTRHARPAAVRHRIAEAGGPSLLLAHSPEVPGGWRGLVVAGHTHCGQIVLPLLGPIAEVTQPRYRCGLVRERGRTTVVTAGTGTSVLPLRLGAPPDWWLLTLSRSRP
jgi:uncharacterized protein